MAKGITLENNVWVGVGMGMGPLLEMRRAGGERQQKTVACVGVNTEHAPRAYAHRSASFWESKSQTHNCCFS